MITAAKGKHIPEVDYQHALVVIGVDVARFGDDRSSICIRQGLACFEPQIYNNIDNMQLANHVMRAIDKYKPAAVFIDAGRGEGVIDRCRQCGYNVIEVHFGSTKTSKKLYLNRRIEMWHRAKQWLVDGGALPDCQQLASDLVVPTYDYNDGGQMRLEKKRKMKERVGRSPDVGDSFCLTFANPVRGSSTPENLVPGTNRATFTNNEYDVI